MNFEAWPIEKKQNTQEEISYILQEKIYEIQADVNMIYDKFFKKFVDDVQNNKLEQLSNYESDSALEFYTDFKKWIRSSVEDVLFGGMMTTQLRTPVCIEASKKLPVPIFCGSFNKGSYHMFVKNDPQRLPHISISLHSFIFHFLINRVALVDAVPSKKLKLAKNEITEARVKASIAHELSHWIDNANYDIFDKILGSAQSGEEKSIRMLLGNKNVNMSYFEIQGQIHGIQQIKNAYEKDWDTMSISDVFSLYTTLHHIAYSLYKKYGKDVFDVWIKFLKKRMAREGLLGKNMSKSLDISYFEERFDKDSFSVVY